MCGQERTSTYTVTGYLLQFNKVFRLHHYSLRY